MINEPAGEGGDLDPAALAALAGMGGADVGEEGEGGGSASCRLAAT